MSDCNGTTRKPLLVRKADSQCACGCGEFGWQTPGQASWPQEEGWNAFTTHTGLGEWTIPKHPCTPSCMLVDDQWKQTCLSLMYKLEQTRVGKAVRLEIHRQNVMTNLVQWISQKKDTELLLWGWWECNGIRIVRAMKKSPMGQAGSPVLFSALGITPDNYYLLLQTDQSCGFRMLRLRTLCCLLSLDFCQPLLGTRTREKGSNFLLLGVSCVCECIGIVAVCIVAFTHSEQSLGMTLRDNILAGFVLGEAEVWMGSDSKQTCHSKESSLWPARRQSRDTGLRWGCGHQSRIGMFRARQLHWKKNLEQ